MRRSPFRWQPTDIRSKLAISDKGYGFTFVNEGVLKFDTEAKSIISNVFIAKMAYSIAVDNVKENIYIGDAKDYSQNGTLFVYNKDGIAMDSATVGIIPGTIVFKH